MKNAKNAYPKHALAYHQTDNKAPVICGAEGAEILASRDAWEKYKWTRKYFSEKPKSGYFIWIKKSINFPLFTCISIAGKNINQNLQNLLVAEKNLKVKIQGTCNALNKNLIGKHRAKGKIVLKENSVLKYEHIHAWGNKDIVDTDYQFFLEKNSKLNYSYKNFFSPKKLKINTLVVLLKNSCADLNILGKFSQTKVDIKDTLILKERSASGIVKLRLVGSANTRISACSEARAESESKCHLDCQGILTSKSAQVFLTPRLVCYDKRAQITHEASIGKVSEEAINYLRMRGLTEKQAIDLIVNGFLSQD